MYEGEHEDDEDAQMEALAEMMDEALMELDQDDDDDQMLGEEEEDGERRARRREAVQQSGPRSDALSKRVVQWIRHLELDELSRSPFEANRGARGVICSKEAEAFVQIALDVCLLGDQRDPFIVRSDELHEERVQQHQLQPQ